MLSTKYYVLSVCWFLGPSSASSPLERITPRADRPSAPPLKRLILCGAQDVILFAASLCFLCGSTRFDPRQGLDLLCEHDDIAQAPRHLFEHAFCEVGRDIVGLAPHQIVNLFHGVIL